MFVAFDDQENAYYSSHFKSGLWVFLCPVGIDRDAMQFQGLAAILLWLVHLASISHDKPRHCAAVTRLSSPTSLIVTCLIKSLSNGCRTDLTRYCVNKNGVITEEPGDLTAYPWDDLVSFYIGCTFAFEEKMIAAGIPLKHVAEKRCVSMYPTNVQCVPVGPFASPLVVSMRPIPKDLVEKALIISAAYDELHGAPVHIGDPSVIGIDLYNSALGEPSDIGDLIPVFWACGRSTSIAVRAASKDCVVHMQYYIKCMSSSMHTV